MNEISKKPTTMPATPANHNPTNPAPAVLTFPTLRRGDGMDARTHLNNDVRQLQAALTDIGYHLTVDGLFGPQTETVLQAFQSDAGLVADGIAGPRTWRAIQESPNFIFARKWDTIRYDEAHPYLFLQLAELEKYKDAIGAVLASSRLSAVIDAREGKIDLPIIAGVLSRECAIGLTLRPRGADGTGDWMPRAVPRGGSNRKGSMPHDGLGYGRGLMQVDYDWHEFARTGAWRDAQANIEYGVVLLGSFYRTIRRRFPEGVLSSRKVLRGALAAYNAGTGRVIAAMQEGRDPDAVTTGGDYARDVLGRAEWFRDKVSLREGG